MPRYPLLSRCIIVHNSDHLERLGLPPRLVLSAKLRWRMNPWKIWGFKKEFFRSAILAKLEKRSHLERQFAENGSGPGDLRGQGRRGRIALRACYGRSFGSKVFPLLIMKLIREFDPTNEEAFESSVALTVERRVLAKRRWRGQAEDDGLRV